MNSSFSKILEWTTLLLFPFSFKTALGIKPSESISFFTVCDVCNPKDFAYSELAKNCQLSKVPGAGGLISWDGKYPYLSF